MSLLKTVKISHVINHTRFNQEPVHCNEPDTFIDFMADHLLSQYILEPTRKDNILDLCISNSPNLISHVSTCDTDMSDHRIADIMLSYNPCNLSKPSPPDFNDLSFRCFDFNRTDFYSVNANLESINWKQLYELRLPEEFPELMTLHRCTNIITIQYD